MPTWSKAILHSLWVATACALVFAAINVLWDANEESLYSNPSAIGVGLAALAVVPLVVAGRWPEVAMALSLVGVVGLTAGGFSRYLAVIAPCLLLPWLARVRSPRVWATVAAVVFLVGLFALREEPYIVGYVGAMALFFIPCVLAAVVVEFAQSNRHLRAEIASVRSSDPAA